MSIELIRQKTFNEMISKLNEFPNLVAVPRPTGFGKTYMSTDLIKKCGYKNILYVYPTEIIKNTVVDRYYSAIEDDTLKTYQAMQQIKGVTLMTYKKLSMLKADDPLFFGYDLIIFDECHRMAALRTLPCARYLKQVNPGVHIVGLTATPNRSDGYDIIESYFEGITVSPYTLHDAFKDGLYKVPVYCFLPGDESNLPESILEDAFMAGENIDNLRVKKVLKKKIIEMSKLYGVEKGIKETCDLYVDTNYMKFICFFSTYKQLLRKSKTVEGWFRSCYPDHKIRTIEVSSRKKDTQENIAKLKTLEHCDKTIDLIFCVDMLNMGYHVSNITGIIMYRTTGSDIIYPQQYGRVLDSGSLADHIIFDIVDNLHRKVKQQKRKSIISGPFGKGPSGKGPTTTVTTTGIDTSGIDIIGPTTTGIDTSGIDIIGPTTPGIDIIGPTTPGIDTPGSNTSGTNTPGPNTSGTDTPGSFGGDKDNPWWLQVSDLDVMNLHLSHYNATYKEQIAKLVAEPMQIRCKEAFEAHFKRWCKMNGYKYPITNKELNILYNADKKDFVKYFENIINENSLNYPMHDAQKLLDIGKTRKDGLPMDIFAKWKNVSISNILDLLEVS